MSDHDACDDARAAAASAQRSPRVGVSLEPSGLSCCCGCARPGNVHLSVGGLLMRLAPACAGALSAKLLAVVAKAD